MDHPAQTRGDVIRRVHAVATTVRGLGVRRLGLFGSFAGGTPDRDGHVDLLVEFVPGQKSFARFNDLYDLLEERLGRRVDLVTTEALSPYFGPTIQAEVVDMLPDADPDPAPPALDGGTALL